MSAPCLEVVAGGLQTMVQDRGRFGFGDIGVPRAGCVDPLWQVLANALVGNPDDQAVLEFRLLGPTLKVHNGPVKIAVCGQVDVNLMAQGVDGPVAHKLEPWRSFTLNMGDELKIGALQGSAAGYVAVGGGFSLDPVMGSLSTYARSAIGGLNGCSLKVGDIIPLTEDASDLAGDGDRLLPNPPVYDRKTVRVVLGPQDDYFDAPEIERFLSEEYVISKASDRMGARLDGPALTHKSDKGAEIASDGVVVGAIQVPGNGQPIVLLNDGQTVGGYPKIACVISADLPLIANAVVGQTVRFEVVSAKEACLIAREQKARLEQAKRSMIRAQANGFINLHALYNDNLIGGVVDMARDDYSEDS